VETARELVVERVPIEDVAEHPRNARHGDVERIKESLAAHGQYAPIVVQASTGLIIKGNHTYRAAAQLGWEYIDVVRVDVDDEQAVRILLIDNRTSDVGRYDDPSLAELLESLGSDLSGTGWDDKELGRLVASLTEPDSPDEFPNVNPDHVRVEYRCPSCGYEWSGKAIH
jgi:ParB-like chromosome segregation protein Spo0J